MEMPKADPGYARQGAKAPFEVVRKGFRREQVLAYLNLVEERISDLETRLDRTKRDLRKAQADLDRAEHERDESRRRLDEAEAAAQDSGAVGEIPAGVSQQVMELVQNFDRDVDLLRTKADLEARRIVAEARTEAANKRIEGVGALREAREQADRLLQQARDEAADVRAHLRPLRELALSEAEAVRDRMKTSLLELEAAMGVVSRDDPVIVVGEAQEQHPAEAPNGRTFPDDTQPPF